MSDKISLTPEQIREAVRINARAIAGIVTPKKTASSRANAEKARAASQTPEAQAKRLKSFGLKACNCDYSERGKHRSRCPVYAREASRRKKAEK